MQLQVNKEEYLKVLVYCLDLPPRYAKVLEVILAVGLDRSRIAKELNVTKKVVSNYLSQLRNKNLIRDKEINKVLYQNKLELHVVTTLKTEG